MKRLGLLILVCGLALSAAEAQVPRRIVSLSPSVTEVLFEAGLGSRVVGVTSYCRFPREVRALPKVGGYLTPSYEAIVRLQPDLVVTLPEQADLEPKLAALGFAVLRVDHRSLDGIIRSIEQLGQRCGSDAEAASAARRLRNGLADVKRAAKDPPPRVLICFGRAQDFRRLTAAAPGTVHDDLITHAGGVNVLTSRTVAYPTLSAESVVRLDPDVIIEFSSGSEDPRILQQQWSRLDSLRAVQRGRVYVFTGDYLSVPGPRFVRSVAAMARSVRGGR